MTKIIIPYKPRNWAKKLHNSSKRFFSLIIHRRGGKSTGLVNHLQRYALDDELEIKRLKKLAPNLDDKDIENLLRDRNYGLILPTYTQAESVAWKMLQYYASVVPDIKVNQQKLSITYPNGSTVRLFGADNPDSLRGIAFSGLAFDEYSQQPSNVFSEVLSKSLADHLGFAIFSGTIKGKNQLYRTNEAAKNNPNEWDYIWQDIDFSLKTEKGATIKTLKIALEDDRNLVKQKMMTEEEFQQEWYLSPEAAIKGAYYAKELGQARKEGRITKVPYMRGLKVHTWWDLGIGDSTVIGFFQKAGLEWHLIDYYEAMGEGLDHYVKILNSKEYLYGLHFAPHDIEVRELGTGKSRKEIAKNLGIDFRIAPNLPIDDGINSLRMRFNTLWIDEIKCARALDALVAYQKKWNEKMGSFDDVPLHNWTSHVADMLRYWGVTKENFDVSIKPVKEPSLAEIEALARIYG